MKLTKYGWFESKSDTYVFRDVTESIKQFLQGGIDHGIIGVKLLTELVSNMNQVRGPSSSRGGLCAMAD